MSKDKADCCVLTYVSKRFRIGAEHGHKWSFSSRYCIIQHEIDSDVAAGMGRRVGESWLSDVSNDRCAFIFTFLRLLDSEYDGTVIPETSGTAHSNTATSHKIWLFYAVHLCLTTLLNALCCYTHSCQMDTLQVLQLQCIVLLHPQLSDGHSTGTSVTMHQSRKCVIPVVCVWN